MPSRIVREGLLDSPGYAALSDAAKLLYIHLLLLADDLGCIAATATFLRRRAFYDTPTNERIAKLMGELVDVDFIRTYTHEQGQYAFIPRYRQRLQRYTLKHPQPPLALLTKDDDAIAKFSKINNVAPKPAVDQRMANGYPTDGQPPEVKRREEPHSRKRPREPETVPDGFADFWAHYPKKLDKKNAVKEWRAIKPDIEMQRAIADGLCKALASNDWKREGGRFIPYACRWLKNRRWDDLPYAPQEESRMGKFVI